MSLSDNIWFGLVEVKPLKDDTIIESAEGAFVNVAYRAIDKDDFIERAKKTFLENYFEAVNFEDIENVKDFTTVESSNAEKVALLNDVSQEGYEFSWGIFYTYNIGEES